MNRHIARRWIPAGLAASIALAATAGEPESPPVPPALRDGVERLAEELRQRERTLEQRERDLAERERSLEALEARLDERLAELVEIRELVDRRIARFSEEAGDRVGRLAKVYAAMPPGRAAPLLQRLEVELATEVLARMKPKKSAAVLAAMAPDRALLLSRRVARPLSGAAGGAEEGRL